MSWAPQDYRSSKVRTRSMVTGDPTLRLLYLELLFAMHESGGDLPADPDELEDVVGLPGEEISRRLPILEQLGKSGRGGIRRDGERITNERIAEQLAEDRAFREIRSKLGSASAAARAKKYGTAKPIIQAEEPPKPKRKPAAEPIPFPANLDTPAFRAAWYEWTAYRRERKLSPWKPRTVKAKLSELSAWGPERAVAAIQSSIANGYQGVFEPKGAIQAADKLAWIRAGGPTRDEPKSGPPVAERLAALADSIPDTAPGAARLRAEIVGLSGSFETVEARLGQIESEALAELESRLANQHIASIEKAVAAVPKGAAAEVRASLIRQRARKLTGIPHLSLVSDAAIPRRKSA